MYSSVSADGFIGDEYDRPGLMFEGLTSGDVPLDESVQYGGRGMAPPPVTPGSSRPPGPGGRGRSS